jgi:hypothetical protein
MPRRKITQSFYDSLVDAFREAESPYKAAQLAGVAPQTARTAWDRGWPKQGFESIKIRFEREKQEARIKKAALDQEKARRERLAAQQQALEQAAGARAQEGQLVDLSRATALQAAAIGAQLVQSARALAEHVDKRMRRAQKAGPKDNDYLSPEDAMLYLQRLGLLLNRISAFSLRTVQLERLVLGEPSLPAETITAQTEMTVEEATIRLEAGMRVLEDVKKHGGLTVIDGGLKDPVIGQKVEAG